jgi:arginyl-tRNA synthetase
MSFYEHCPILKSDVPTETANSRLQLSAFSADVLSKGLDLLGIEVMEKM